ncbi:MAG: amidohydrolase [Pseudomonadota bacterium]
MTRLRYAALIVLCAAAFHANSQQPAPSAGATVAASRVYLNGVVFTADAAGSLAEAIAVRAGRIVYVGSNKGVAAHVGPGTETRDLRGRFVMPGIIDGHTHPFMAGAALTKCNLNYAVQTIAQFQHDLQACLDSTSANEPDGWLEVVYWNRESMVPVGTKVTRVTLDALRTRRPIIVLSSQGHAGAANSRALGLAHITAATADPVGGHIDRDARGEPTGLFEESAAYGMVTALLPKPTPAEDFASAEAAQKALNRQGVTGFLDAWAPEESMAAFAALGKAGKLTIRAHFAPVINPDEAPNLDAAVKRIVDFRSRYDQGPEQLAPSITVRNAKLFLDGVIYAPAFTGAMVDPYRQNAGTPEKPRWVGGTSRGPAVYFPPQVLAGLMLSLARAGIDPHMHADGDGAVHAALDAVAVLRRELPTADIRPTIAHDEIVWPADFLRFRQLNVTAALGFQWAQRADYTLGLTDYFGPARMRIAEPSGLLAAKGARLSLGSDWPVDPLDEWFAFKVGVTRRGRPDAAPEYRGRFGSDPGLSVRQVLRAATINAAYQLHDDDVTGSLEVGKYADLIVLDRNPLTIPAADIADVRVLETTVGGKVVYQTD